MMCGGLIILLAGILLFAVELSWLYWRKDFLIDLPVPLSSRQHLSFTLAPNISTGYNLDIVLPHKFESGSPFGCEFGASPVNRGPDDPSECSKEIRRVFDAKWSVKKDAVLIASSRGMVGTIPPRPESRDATEVIIGQFDLISGSRYTLDINILRYDLGRAHSMPQLVLYIANNEGEVVLAQMGSMLCLLLAVIGFATAMISAIVILLRGRRGER